MKDGYYYEHQDGGQKGQDPAKFVGDGAKNGVGEQEVPLRFDVGRGYQRVSGGKIVWVS